MKAWYIVSFIEVYIKACLQEAAIAIAFSSSLTFPAISISIVLSLYFSWAFNSLPEVFEKRLCCCFESKAIFGPKHAFDQAEPVSANLAFQKGNMLQLFTE